MKLFMQNAFPPQESNQDPSRFMRRLYPPLGLEPNERDKSAKSTLQCIINLYAQMRVLNDEYEIAMIRQRIADLKLDRMDYVEHCWLHNRYRRS